MNPKTNSPMHDNGNGLSRRNMIKSSVAAGALVWSAPMILSRPAHAQVASGSPVCVPTVNVACGLTLTLPVVGTVGLPGLTIGVGGCPCVGTAPDVCVQIVANAGSADFVPVVVVAGEVQALLALDEFVCVAADASLLIIPPVENAPTRAEILGQLLEPQAFSFRIAVSATCDDGAGGVATTCTTFEVNITVDVDLFPLRIDLECTAVIVTDPVDSLCTGDVTCECP